MLAAIGLLVIGLVVLVAGGELLVRGASRLAIVAGIPPLVVGLTVVAFGTSAPELAVSLKACFRGQTDIAVGNVVGSNIFNLLFILGLSSMIAPMSVSSQLVRLDVPLLVAASVAVLWMGLDGVVSRLDGSLLFAALLGYMCWTVYATRRESAEVQQEFTTELARHSSRPSASIAGQLLLIVVGLALLVLGARWLVEGAVTTARLFGMSELLIGLTIVATGTSLPEVAASVLASFRGQRDIAVGNAVGSSTFNILCVLALSAVAAPAGVPVSDSALQLDVPVMIAAAVACLPVFFTGHSIARWEGALLFAYYWAYTAYLVLAATMPGVSRTFGHVMIGYVVPLTMLTLAVGVYRSIRSPRKGEADAA